MKRYVAPILLAAIISSLSGCATSPPAQIRLSLPPPLVLPKVHGSDLQCLSDDAYLKLTTRDTLQRERIKTLEDIIRSTR